MLGRAFVIERLATILLEVAPHIEMVNLTLLKDIVVDIQSGSAIGNSEVGEVIIIECFLLDIPLPILE